MNYCRHCMVPTEEEACPLCGEKKLWPILPEDPCFVVELQEPWSGIFSDVLRQKAIPALAKPQWGAGWTATLGSKFERYRFYGPYEYLPAAGELAEELFSRSEEETGEDEEE